MSLDIFFNWEDIWFKLVMYCFGWLVYVCISGYVIFIVLFFIFYYLEVVMSYIFVDLMDVD